MWTLLEESECLTTWRAPLRGDPSSLGGFESNSFFFFTFCSRHAWLPATSAWWTIFNPPVSEQLWCGATQRADNSSGAHSKSQLCQQTLIILLHFEPACISHCAYCCLPSHLECLCQRRRAKLRPILQPARDEEPRFFLNILVLVLKQ